ncbi:MAG: amino acid adenylation domain-containing protein [Candidatus Riflebacteria bacterium]|nr:amino acid adenylation domain-containing protein [Candidatus Riflebacteria bacterium]
MKPSECELLHELFEFQADLYPDNIAISYGSEKLTYKTLEKRANQVAHYLRSMGVSRGDYVAVMIPRSPNLYIILLGILKSGAAYLPLDPDYPIDRIHYILSDCHVHTLITVSSLSGRLPKGAWKLLEFDKSLTEIFKTSFLRITRNVSQTTSQDVCYIIYTSGSTGKPKGVQIEHRNVVHLVRAEGEIFHLASRDLIYQGFSIAFDASVEEIWLAFFAGATLVPATPEMAHSGPELSRMLTELGVTVLSCVPTLLSMLTEDIPTLRLLILGGEAFPTSLMQKWVRPGLRVVNTYGPTETTVIATYSECHPEKPVTIGKPAPGYSIFCLDESFQKVPENTCGEIFIGGLGLARGYLGRADLTAEKFIPNPFGEGRLYRTGDLGCFNSEGEIEFRGRIDGQVKLRGFRIELEEIENALRTCSGVRSAAVAVREDLPGIQQLVGYLIPSDVEIDEERIRAHLGEFLPPFMIPTIFETIDKFPILTSGKVDRAKLPVPRPKKNGTSEKEIDLPRNFTEQRIASIWEKLFVSHRKISRNADFFHDLGGHSLLAASFVSMLRSDPDFHDLSVLDVYSFPVLSALAGEIEKRRARKEQIPTKQSKPNRATNLNYWLCGLLQILGLYVLIEFAGLQWLIPYFAEDMLARFGIPVFGAFVLWFGMYLLMFPISIIGKWLIIGRYRPGVYPVWGFYYLRWWLVERLQSMVPLHFLMGTPWLVAYARLMGAKIGKNVFLGTDHLCIYDLLKIGDGTSIGQEACLLGYVVRNGWLHISSISIGSGCFVGPRSVLANFSEMEDGARLEGLSLLPEGQRIPIEQTWAGSPAIPSNSSKFKSKKKKFSVIHQKNVSTPFSIFLQTIGILVLMFLPILAVLPGGWVTLYFEQRIPGSWLWCFAPIIGLTFIPTFLFEIVLLKWFILKKAPVGTFPLSSTSYVRKWFVDQVLDLSLVIAGPVYATLYVVPWFRLMGAYLGSFVEISTAHSTTPDLLHMDEGSFIADSVSLGVPHIERGWITLAPTRIGTRTFVGNSAVVPAGKALGPGGLLGVASTTPEISPGAEQSGTSWLGSPSFFLPRRHINTAFPSATTYHPTTELIVKRLMIEFFRVTLPSTFTFFLDGLLVLTLISVQSKFENFAMILSLPLLYLAFGVVAALIVTLAKWILIGRYRSDEKPLWSTFVWRTELITALHEHLADPFLVRMLRGTPFISWFFRLLGAKIGARVYIETTSLTEFDLISIGDDASLNQDSVVQTHLFEDRVMKMSNIQIGDGCTLGIRAIILYDTVMGQKASLGDLSLLMKGETLPDSTSWTGLPCRLDSNFTR